jgi:hypothetical protein
MVAIDCNSCVFFLDYGGFKHMSHKAKLAALVLGSLISSQAFGYMDWNMGRAYVLAGGGYGFVQDGKLESIDVVGTNATLNADDEWQGLFHGGLGMQISGPWGIETNYWQYANINDSANNGGGQQVNQRETSHAVDLTVIGRACLMDPLTGYARLGVGYGWMNRSNSLNNLLTTDGDDRDEDGVGVSGALGLEYAFTDWVFGRLEVATITGNAMQSNATLNLGVRFS